MSTLLSRSTLSIAALFCLALTSCGGGGHEVSQWKRPGSASTGKSLQPVAVFAAIPSAALRKEYEDAIVSALAARGISAKPTYPAVALAQVKADRDAAIAKIAPAGSVLAVRTATALSMKAFTISPSNDGSPLKPWQNWFDFFSAQSAFTEGPVDVRSTPEIGIHAALYEYPSGRLDWSATAVRPTAGIPSPSTSAQKLASLLASTGLVK